MRDRKGKKAEDSGIESSLPATRGRIKHIYIYYIYIYQQCYYHHCYHHYHYYHYYLLLHRINYYNYYDTYFYSDRLSCRRSCSLWFESEYNVYMLSREKKKMKKKGKKKKYRSARVHARHILSHPRRTSSVIKHICYYPHAHLSKININNYRRACPCDTSHTHVSYVSVYVCIRWEPNSGTCSKELHESCVASRVHNKGIHVMRIYIYPVYIYIYTYMIYRSVSTYTRAHELKLCICLKKWKRIRKLSEVYMLWYKRRTNVLGDVY